MCRLRRFVRVSSSSNLTTQTRFLSRSRALLSLRLPDFCCAFKQLQSVASDGGSLGSSVEAALSWVDVKFAAHSNCCDHSLAP